MILAFLLGIPFTAWIVILALLFLTDVACFAFEAYGWSLTIMIGSIAGAIWLDHNAGSWLAHNLHSLLLWYIPGYIIAGFGTAFVKWILYTLKRVGWIKEAKTQFDMKKFEPEKPDFSKSAEKLARNEQSDTMNRDAVDRLTANLTTTGEDAKAARAAALDKYNARVAELTAEIEAKWTASLPAQKREAFVTFYTRGLRDGAFGVHTSHKTYDVDHSKETSVVDALSPRAKDNIGKITIWIFQWPVVIVASLIEDFIIKLAKHFATALDAMFSKVVRGMVAKVTKGL